MKQHPGARAAATSAGDASSPVVHTKQISRRSTNTTQLFVCWCLAAGEATSCDLAMCTGGVLGTPGVRPAASPSLPALRRRGTLQRVFGVHGRCAAAEAPNCDALPFQYICCRARVKPASSRPPTSGTKKKDFLSSHCGLSAAAARPGEGARGAATVNKATCRL